MNAELKKGIDEIKSWFLESINKLENFIVFLSKKRT
jgi:hypothetical protein